MERFTMTSSANRTFENYPGYPEHRFTRTIDPNQSLQNIELPDGPWTFKNYPLPDLETSLGFINEGYETDSLGRPLHPWARSLLREENGGAVLGKGAYWNWGPNATADPIVITNEPRPQVLLIKRSDTGALALPGGFVDANETPACAALRELEEETGLVLDTAGELVYQGPVADLRTTLHAWAETSAYLFTVDVPSNVRGNDDALNADWYFLDELPTTLFGSHAQLVQRAIELNSQKTRSIRDILAIPDSERTTTPIDAGHMAYRHYTTSHQQDSLFVKEHDASQFSDPAREAHSRAYLLKEHALYSHLAAQGYTSIPERVDLIDDSLLAMDFLSRESGWHWKAPKEAITQYTEDILAALDTLQSTQILQAPEFHRDIAPTYETFWREGWDAIDDDSAVQIVDRITQFAEGWTSGQRDAAIQLAESFEDLRAQAATLERSPQLYPAHNDARQSNIAWHPEKGVKIVDWSWADLAPENADATMLLIDLAKSGHQVEQYSEKINKEYALLLLGFWLAHSIWDTRDGGTTVREHQVASAATALALLNLPDQRKD